MNDECTQFAVYVGWKDRTTTVIQSFNTDIPLTKDKESQFSSSIQEALK